MASSGNDKSVEFMYTTKTGKMILQLALALKVPKTLGFFLRSPISRFYINSFVKKNGIDMTGFEGRKFKSFNDFFTRKKDVSFDPDLTHLITPADSLLSAFKIDETSTFHVKGFDYTLEDFFGANEKHFSEETKAEIKELIGKFSGGDCLIFRLCATDYHRYSYIDNGKQGNNHFIEGSLYSVQPAACENFRVYTKNRRNWSLLETENFGTVAQIEVGAFSVGGIVNHLNEGNFKKGDEKGYFDLHGSTIVMLFQKDKIKLSEEITEALNSEPEYRVKIGQKIGEKC
ncbi:MAG: phosphatidylserine decarboxylase [Treponema sp.]|nr:phosphatidylserine decarboxylase [Candidatus Treponema equifaecale]